MRISPLGARPDLLAVAFLACTAAPPASAVSLAAGGDYGVAHQVTGEARCGLRTVFEDHDGFAQSGVASTTAKPISTSGNFDCGGMTQSYTVGARAGAALAPASLGVYALANSSIPGYADASAEASLYDVISLSGIAIDPIGVFIPFTVSGLSSGDVLIGQFRITARDPSGEVLDSELVSLLPSDWESASTSMGTDRPRTYTSGLAFDVPASAGAFLLTMSAVVGVAADGRAGFADTATIDAIVVPDGVTWTSDSGVFLTAPEPGAAALLAVSLAVLARRGRR